MNEDSLSLTGRLGRDMGTQMTRVTDKLKRSEFVSQDSWGMPAVVGGYEIEMEPGIGVNRDDLVAFVSTVLRDEDSTMVVRCMFSGERLRINRFGAIERLEDEILPRGAAPREMTQADGFKTLTGEVGYMTSRAGRSSKPNEDGCGWGVDVRNDATRDQLGTLHLISVDGIGGAEHGELASKIFLESAINGFSDGKSTAEVHQDAHERMKAQGVGNGGVSYVAAHISIHGVMRISQAGDERLLLVRGSDASSIHTIDQSEYYEDLGREALSNAVTGYSAGKSDPGYVDIQLDPGSIVVLASDGLWKFVQNEEVEEVVISEKDPRTIAQKLYELSLSRMNPSIDSGDNINILVYRHDQSAEG